MAGPGKNYTLGRGELHFARFLPGTQTPEGERYIGNSPEFGATIETENLDHYNSDRGIREKDESIPLQTNRSASFTTDNISPENIAYFFFGDTSAFATAAATVAEEEYLVAGGLTYQIGMTPQNPSGARKLEVHTAAVGGDPAINVIVTDGAAVTPVTFVEGTDYTVDMDRARLYIVPGGAIAAAAALLPAKVVSIEVSYKVAASSRTRVLSGSKPVEGALRYISYNPVGENFDWYMPYVKLSPNGDYQLKGDEWQQIPFSVEILKLGDMEAIYIDGQALVA